MELKLSVPETALLTRVLDSALKELRVEVRRTDTRSVHDELEQDAECIRGILNRLREAAESA
jgi:hypothetical protein